MRVIFIVVALFFSASTAFAKQPVPGGPNGAVQFNDSGSFAGDGSFSWTSSSSWLELEGNPNTSLMPSITLNANGGQFTGVANPAMLYVNANNFNGSVLSITDGSNGGGFNMTNNGFGGWGISFDPGAGGNISFSEGQINEVGDPSHPDDAATKRYVDTHSPSGTLCGWYDSTAAMLVVSCQGQDPSISCPEGYAQKTSTSAKFCAAN